ncbi:Zn-dependent exopeptidase [Hysterangium stoloniferum]|nr:Zn-dependent exopeptidase [Hysterangium stoloniferum]
MPCLLSDSNNSLITPPSSPGPPLSKLNSPRLTHTLHHNEKSSVLSLAADSRHIFSGCQTADIHVWDRSTFQVKKTLQGHTGSVLALEIDPEREWLFSASSDSTVRIWSTCSLSPLYILTPHLDTSAGDIFSLTFSPALQTLYFGCQNTSLQWYDFSKGTHTGLGLDRKKWHRFFDNTSRLGRPVPLSPSVTLTCNASASGASTPSTTTGSCQPRVLQVSPQNIIHSAHYGYIYCMVLLPSPREAVTVVSHRRCPVPDPPGDPGQTQTQTLLMTGSGDETVKVWKCTSDGPSLIQTFECNQGGVWSLVARDGTVYAGCQDGCVAVWDLETGSLVRLILAQENSDVLSMSMVDTDLYTCSANGWIQRWNAQFACTASWRAHEGIVMSSIVTNARRVGACSFLITGANDNDVKVWEIHLPTGRPFADSEWINGDATSVHDPLTQSLSQFVSMPSVSNSPHHREDCRQAAIWLKRCLSQLGADAKMIAAEQGTNPLVLATFKGVPTAGDTPRPRILFYSHYDVVAAPHKAWSTPPFTLTGRNGYLYGRGVSDNKGPILAVAYAVSDLLRRRMLGCDVVMLAEGEEEAGSGGFENAVRTVKGEIWGERGIDAVLISNSYWIDEKTPCITYGLRGVVHATVDISNKGQDLHSGMEGGSVREPMIDMVKLLASLTSGSQVLIPEFYDQVRPLDPSEQKSYAHLSSITNKPAQSLSSRWREPSLSIHSIETRGPGNSTIIPSKVSAKVSIRIVPNQSLATIANALVEHLNRKFDELESPNLLDVKIDRQADWWLGDLESKYFKALENAVEEEWGMKPLKIREGGSIPSVPFLEKEFGCPGLHLPMGQSSDQAHLANERISLTNLRKGKAVVERFLLAVSQDTPFTPGLPV